MRLPVISMYEGLKNIYFSPNLTGDVLLLPSKYIHTNFWGASTREDRIKAIAYDVFDLLIQVACLPLTVIGCSIKLFSVNSFMQKSALLGEDALRRFDSIQTLWQSNFKSFDRQTLGSIKQRSNDEEQAVSESILVSDVNRPEACAGLRERLKQLIIAKEKKFSLITGIENGEGRTPTGAPTYVVTLYFQG